MALKKHKPLPEFRPPPPPSVTLLLDEADALMRAMLGDHFDVKAADRAIAKIQDAKEKAGC